MLKQDPPRPMPISRAPALAQGFLPIHAGIWGKLQSEVPLEAQRFHSSDFIPIQKAS